MTLVKYVLVGTRRNHLVSMAMMACALVMLWLASSLQILSTKVAFVALTGILGLALGLRLFVLPAHR